jgi:hypothetical protein
LSALTPVWLLLFLRCRERRGVPVYFFGLGALFNLHPVSAFHLAQVVGLGHVVLARSWKRAGLQVALGMVLFVAAALPLALVLMADQGEGLDPTALAEVREAVHYRFPYALYPLDGATAVSLTIHAALLVGVTAWLLRHGTLPDDLVTLLWLALIAVILGLGGAALLQAISHLADRPPVDILQMRAAKFAYPALLAALATAYARLLGQRSRRARCVLAVLIGLSLVPPGLVIHGSPAVRHVVKQSLGLGGAGVPSDGPGEAAPDELWPWVRAHTAQDALFFTESAEFRDRTLRSITGTFKDGGWFYLGGTRAFHAWYLYMRDVERCRAAQGHGCWFELGLRHRADYVVLDPGVRLAAPPEHFSVVWRRGNWSLWRHDGRVSSPPGVVSSGRNHG